MRLAEALGDSPFGLVADLGNILFVDECPECFIGLFADKIVHVHCKDYLLKSGNDGWYSVEYSALEPHDVAIPLAIENLQRIYGQVHATDMCMKDLI